jgi:hypothetical protein
MSYIIVYICISFISFLILLEYCIIFKKYIYQIIKPIPLVVIAGEINPNPNIVIELYEITTVINE